LTPPGRLRPLAKDTEALMSLVEKASEENDMNRARIGYARIEHFTWKDILDFYSCTECGRCSDHCPAYTTGKKLSPKHLTLDLREAEAMALTDGVARWRPDAAAPQATVEAEPEVAKPGQPTGVWAPKNLVPDIIDPDVIWACTTCRACEEQCPVMITYVDKIV